MNKAIFDKDESNKTITVTRKYDVPRSKVWEAWTTSELLQKWWGPEPWKAITKSFEFKEGGHWLYAMTGPEGEKHWAILEYLTINPEDSFTARDAFCDEEGVVNTELPNNDWQTVFKETDGGTTVIVTIVFASAEDMKKLTEMGFEEGFTMGLDQLEALLTE